MRKLFIAILLTLTSFSALAAVSSATIAKYLPGTWKAVTEVEGQRIEGTTTYNRDKTFTYLIQVNSPQGTAKFTGAGKWSIKGNVIHSVVTQSNNEEVLKVGTVMKDTVTFIDEHQFSHFDEEGTAATMHRD